MVAYGNEEADGKKIQIQLTGFMEKNTMKFMKELWSLLLSAQQNASGVPQQFLDEKEAEIHKKKDGDAGNSRSYGDPVASALNSTNFNIEEEKDNDFKRTSRPKNSSCTKEITIYNSKVSCSTQILTRKEQTTVPISRKPQAMVSVSNKTSVPISKTAEEVTKLTEDLFCKSTFIATGKEDCRSPSRSCRSLSRDIEKETNGTPFTKNRAVHSRVREQKTDDNDRDGARIGGHHSPDFEHRLSKSVRSPNNEERNSTLDSGKGVQKKHPDQLSESSEDELAGRRTKRQTDSPDDHRGKHNSPTRIENDDSYSKNGRNSEHVMRGLHDGSDDAKKYLSKVNEDSQSEDGSPSKKKLRKE
ncbi:PWI domain-containing protein C825.05c [Zea mays]|uniref:PWI domain-containing protein C825.05c n=2 Tax=Zea mays TaxID=4577 RepID=A0A8J8XAE0_MAIZE|nr:splicing factor PWI domain-containing protein [Zea mays]PWZ06490.1 PWI domain-containing protein C825.05c [Zea mays]